MKKVKILSVPFIAGLILGVSACGGTDISGPSLEESSVAATSDASAPSDELVVSTAATCKQLMGSGTDGPIFEGVDFVMTLTSHEGVDSEDIASAREVAERLRPIADRSGDELKPYMEAFLEPAEALVKAADGDGQYKQNFDDWQSASTELLIQCGSDASNTSATDSPQGIGAPAAAADPAVGEPFTVDMLNGNVAKITIVSATRSDVIPGDFTLPPANGSFLVLDVLWETETGTTSANPFYFAAQDAQGREGEAELFVDGQLASENVPVGGQVRGTIAFDIVPGPVTVTIADPLMEEAARIRIA